MKKNDYVILKDQPQLIRRIIEVVGDSARTIAYNTKNEEGNKVTLFPLSRLKEIPRLGVGDIVCHQWNTDSIAAEDNRRLGIVLGGNHVVTKVVWPYARQETNVKTMNLVKLGKLQCTPGN